jgi:hypothetical protein
MLKTATAALINDDLSVTDTYYKDGTRRRIESKRIKASLIKDQA